MKRLTKIFNNKYFIDAENVQKEQNGYAGDAIEYLGELENVYEEFESKLEKIETEMEKYRISGKQKTIIFRELMGKKVMTKSILDVFMEKCKYLKNTNMQGVEN